MVDVLNVVLQLSWDSVTSMGAAIVSINLLDDVDIELS